MLTLSIIFIVCYFLSLYLNLYVPFSRSIINVYMPFNDPNTRCFATHLNWPLLLLNRSLLLLHGTIHNISFPFLRSVALQFTLLVTETVTAVAATAALIYTAQRKKKSLCSQ